MKNQEIKFKDKLDSYSVFIGSNTLNILPHKIKKLCPKTKKIALIIDKKIPNKFKKILKSKLKDYNVFLFSFSSSEKMKSFKTVDYFLKALLSKNFNRSDLVIGVGGGITGDVVSFVASIYKRGINFINIPTTLLAQVDSAIGGKTGVNSSYGKNLIGSFYQPKMVISDTEFLKSLPKREIVCGYGEILKHSLILNKVFYNYLKNNSLKIINLESPFIEKAILESCKIKKAVVEKDEKEKNFRKILNFGHTFAHAFEAALGYSNKLNHGEAVILGMVTALKFSFDIRLIKFKEFNKILNDIQNTNLPFNIKSYFSLKDLNLILNFMKKDKKNFSERINLILLKKIGSAVIDKEYNSIKIKKFLIKELVD